VPTILVVDDDRTIRDGLVRTIAGAGGLTARAAEGVVEARAALRRGGIDGVLLDVRLKDGDGIDLLAELRVAYPGLPVVMATAYGDSERTIHAMKLGAFDYVTKPFDLDQLLDCLRRAVKAPPVAAAPAGGTNPGDAEGPALVGSSARMLAVWKAIGRASTSMVSVLITGESGTGKELVARAIHFASQRRYHPLVAIHCGALTETLLESELFGHEKGAFTGAQYRKKGKFEVAEGGTVFLDEIGDISLRTQTDMLRVLQEHEIVRVGGNTSIKVDFRCVAATNKPLEQAIEEGRFRPDLYYRLNVFRIEIPPLRERRDDIPMLVDHFVRKFSKEMNKRMLRVSPRAMDLLQSYHWPGNIRELENAVERAMVVGQEPELRDRDFTIQPHATTAQPLPDARSLEDIEKTHILRVLDECGGNQTRAAEVLDIDRVTLHHKLKKYGWSKQLLGAPENK